MSWRRPSPATIHPFRGDETPPLPREALALADVYFCPQCPGARSPYQCQYLVEHRFCPQCQHLYPGGAPTCTRNCFVCPRCASPVSIAMDDVAGGKQFGFRCTVCEFAYDTGVITTPKLLHSIVTEEAHGPELRYFAQLTRQLRDGPVEPQLDEKTRANLALSGVAPPKSDPDPVAATSPEIPQGRLLVAKRAVRCGECHFLLVLPNLEVKTPLVLKFGVKFCGVDYLPSLSVVAPTGGTGARWAVLNATNPGETPMEITLSAPSELPREYRGETPVFVRLPVPLVTLAPSLSEDALKPVKAVPTLALTEFSPVSKGELVLRRGNQPKIPDDLDGYVETGHNWALVLLEVTLELPEPVVVPLYVHVTQPKPKALAKIGPAKYDYGFWAMVRV